MSELKADKTFVFGEECEAYKKSEADKVIAHQKYKRCLAMAKWCESEANYWYDTTLVQQRWHYGFYVSWCEKWLKLSDQFSDKEA